MDEHREQQAPRRRRWAPIGLLFGGLLAGGILAGTQVAGAQESTPSASAGAPATDADHGPRETLLTGENADRAEAAALEKFPGATVIRVETDSGDASYEAHLERSDGSRVTVLLDEDFNVTGTETGFGNCPHDDAADDPAA